MPALFGNVAFVNRYLGNTRGAFRGASFWPIAPRLRHCRDKVDIRSTVFLYGLAYGFACVIRHSSLLDRLTFFSCRIRWRLANDLLGLVFTSSAKTFKRLPQKRRSCSCEGAIPVGVQSCRLRICFPIFLIFGHAAGVAASMALVDSVAVHDVNVTYLQEALRKGKSFLA
jgi:hypothetical protein